MQETSEKRVSDSAPDASVKRAVITFELSDDELDVIIQRPLSYLHVLYGVLMWSPAIAIIAFSYWFLTSGIALAGRTVVLAAVALIPACFLYGVLAVMAVSGWSRRQHLRIRSDVVRKQYPVGPVRSFSLPVWVRISDPRAVQVSVLSHHKDTHSENRPAFKDRLLLTERHRKLLTFGPTLTLSEAEEIAERINRHCAQWPRNALDNAS